MVLQLNKTGQLKMRIEDPTGVSKSKERKTSSVSNIQFLIKERKNFCKSRNELKINLGGQVNQ